MKLTIEFSGGAEFLVDNVKTHEVDVPTKDEDSPLLMQQVIFWIRDNLIRERVELFMQDDTVRPGILVLVNGTDWELCDGLANIMNDGDIITFISTLHGG